MICKLEGNQRRRRKGRREETHHLLDSHRPQSREGPLRRQENTVRVYDIEEDSHPRSHEGRSLMRKIFRHGKLGSRWTSRRKLSKARLSSPPTPSISLFPLSMSAPGSDVVLEPPKDTISSLTFSPDSSRLLVSSWDGVSLLPSLERPRLELTFPSFPFPSFLSLLLLRCSRYSSTTSLPTRPCHQQSELPRIQLGQRMAELTYLFSLRLVRSDINTQLLFSTRASRPNQQRLSVVDSIGA